MAVRIICGQIVKDRKRKAFGGDEVPAKKLKVTPNEVKTEMETADLSEEQIGNVFEDLVSKRGIKLENFVNIEQGNI